MKRILCSLLLVSAAFFRTAAQEKSVALPKCSPLTQAYLAKSADLGGMMPGYVYRQDGAGKIYISALLKAGPSIKETDLQQMGAVIGTKAGNIWTVHVPLDKVAALARLKGAQYLQLDEPVFPTMDSVRKVTRVDSVHAGIDLPAAFSGKDVVLGILDVGFDYTHPLFYDTAGTHYRVRRIWEQKTTGTPPAGFSSGRELTDTTAMRAANTDIATQSHGTHVAGIAGGSGVGSGPGNVRFRGIGFSTDVVLVGITPPQNQWMNTGMTDLIEGMSYVYDYAAAVGKPAVVNLSWGCSVGPHDGLSLFSQAVDNLTGSGKLFVCSAGNTGTDNIHLQKTFTATDTMLNTFVEFDGGLSEKKTWVDAWGDSSKTFCAKVTLYNGSAAGNATGFVCLDNALHTFYLVGSGGDTCFVDMTTSTAEFNGKPRIFLSLRNRTADKVALTFSGTDARLHVWEGYVENSTGYYGALTNGGFPWATTGNTDLTISDFSSTKSAIAVGAFAARNAYRNVSNQNVSYTSYVSRGRLVPFSSHGPTADGRISPEITAPGFVVASGINSFDASFNSGGGNFGSVFSTFSFGSRTYSYAMLSGTSMSSPVVSGIVALMLEANPGLTPQQVKNILAETALTDALTGAIPAAGNNTWGHGKVNAYGALKKIVRDLSINVAAGEKLNWSLYPNPNNGSFTIHCTAKTSAAIRIEILDMKGSMLLRKNALLGVGSNTLLLDAGRLVPGVYFARLSAGNKSGTVKMIVE